ncbi:MAG: hypothetical protein HFI40_06390 [Lachnospiraceae bacterium]|jgi:hypothetical protein|nr:hypothetical protein [Lachnospiraceae bacterium]
MELHPNALQPFLLFDKAIPYNEAITLHPVRMKDFLSFQQFQLALTLRKDSIFRKKEYVKMGYLAFLQYACRNTSLAREYRLPLLPFYYDFLIGLLQLSCGENATIRYSPQTLAITINGFALTEDAFDDIRKILLLQNDIDFDPEEFMNIDTVHALEKAREFELKKKQEQAEIEDYIDSLTVSLGLHADEIANLTVRKFWRYIKRMNRHEEYLACRFGQMSGFVTFKEPLSHWMTSIGDSDKDEALKADEGEIRGKING